MQDNEKKRLKQHAFAIVAYGDCRYLEECIVSLKNQSVSSEIIICTSTPSDFIESLSLKYNIPVFVNHGEGGIAGDWNFAFEKANAQLVTLAHQDDVYHYDYVKELLNAKKRYPDMSLFTTSSNTMMNGNIVVGKVEIIKKLLRLPLRIAALNKYSFVKMASIFLGNPIICPSCTYDKNYCGDKPFNSRYKVVLDWDFLYRLAIGEGRWVCIEKPLINYRVHAGATTSQGIKDHTREKEEAEMFERILKNQTVVNFVAKLYKRSYKPYLKQINGKKIDK